MSHHHPTHHHTVTHIARRDPQSPVGRVAIVDALDLIDAVYGPDFPDGVAAERSALAGLLRSVVIGVTG